MDSLPRHYPAVFMSLLAVLASLCLTLCTRHVHAADSPEMLPPDRLSGESLLYRVDFWVLRGSAVGELCFTKTGTGYRALFEAETRGALRLLAGYRKEIMESVMEYDHDRQRLRPVIFREIFLQHGEEYRREITFDYGRGVFTCTRTVPGCRTRVTKKKLPEGDLEDLLSLFYNFRLGCYGPLRQGARHRVPVIMKEIPSTIVLDFPAPGSKNSKSGFNTVLTMDRAITNAFSRRVHVLLGTDDIAESALVVDAYLFGDLGITLTGLTYYE